MRYLVVGMLLAVSSTAPSAWAQSGQATSSTVQGHNTVQQAPSGGRTGGATDGGQSGQSTPEQTNQDRAVERQNDAATQICKGC
jgi:hypothetical protein